MSVLDRVRQFFKGKGSNKEFVSSGLFNQADNTLDALMTLDSAFKEPLFRADLVSAITAIGNNGHSLYLTGAAYQAMLNKVSPAFKRQDQQQPLYTLDLLTEHVIADLRNIMENFKEFFPEENITDEEFKMSNLIISGYIQAAYEYSKWLSAIVLVRNHYGANGHKTNPETLDAPAKYLVDTITKAQPYTNSLAQEIFNRRGHDSFTSILISLKVDSKDVSVTKRGLDITVYAEDSQYQPQELKYAHMGMINPFHWISQRQAVRNRLQYARNKELKEWVRTRIMLLEREQAELDPNSADYKRYETAMNNYVAEIASLDKKIEQYEM